MSWDDEAVVEDISAAGRLLSDTISGDVRCLASGDLLDSLDASRYSSNPYSSPPKEWPSFIDVANARELPPALVERYNAASGQGTSLCGLFPTIRRAWATVDETLFLWRFDKWDGICPEYNGEEQAICAVGLAKVKPGIFVEAIQHLLVLATPVELVLLGVCCSGGSDGNDPFAELSLQPLPEYTIPTDGVIMTCVSTTDKGRIFLGGRDGHIYELLYSTGMGWQSRCRKVCHTGSFKSLLSRWVIPNALKFGAVDSVAEIVIDDERNILYTRSQESKIQVFDLGKCGDSAPKKIVEERNVWDQKEGRPGAARALANRVGGRVGKTSIVSISPVSSAESKWLHLVAIASDGRRIYLSTTPAMGGGSQVAGPSVLRTVTTRPAPSIGMGGSITFGSLSTGARSQSEALALKVEAAQYSSGVLVLSDSSPATTSRLLVATRDFSAPLVSSGSLPFGAGEATGRSMRALRELVSLLGVEGRTLAIADVLPPPEQSAAALASVWIPTVSIGLGELAVARSLWARGELATQHILPRRRIVVFSTIGIMEVIINRPVDLLQRLFETNAPRSSLEDFFQRFGTGEAAAMCLLLAARLVSEGEKIVSTAVAEKAAEAFEDPRLVGIPRMQGGGAMATSLNSVGGGFNMGQVVQEAEPVFSGAHEGLCLCVARLLWGVWELPVFVVKGDGTDVSGEAGGIISSRLPDEAMIILEDRVRSLEQFLRSRRNQRRGHYGRVMGIGDISAYGDRQPYDHEGLHGPMPKRTLFDTPENASKRQRLAYNPAELIAMEVRGMECIRRLLRRSGEALLLLQLLSRHHLTRLAQSLDATMRRQLVQLTFHQLVCSEDGDQITTRLIAALMEYYISPDGRGTVDDISAKLREGCPSYYNESDYTFYQAVECLERAASAADSEEQQRLAREALSLLGKVPESADLLSVCQRFEDLRFYEAVIELPMRKAKALDPNEDAFNERIDENRHLEALAVRQQCYAVVTNALRSLMSQVVQNSHRPEFKSPGRPAGARQIIDAAARDVYVRQIVQLSLRWPDRAFHEQVYQTMIELGLERELLELGGPDLVPFLQSAGNFQSRKAGARSPVPAAPSMTHVLQPISMEQAKYLELLSRYYVHKRQHALAAHVLLRLAERRQVEGAQQLTLEQRFDYLSNAVLQARSISHGMEAFGSPSEIVEGGLLELLEGKLAVLRFQIKIYDALRRIVDKAETVNLAMPSSSTAPAHAIDEPRAAAAEEKADELAHELKSITQLYNEYAVRFELWEVCLEILHFSHYTGDSDNTVMRETWARLLDQAINMGGVAEACTVVKRVGPLLYPGDGGSMPLDSICLHLERAAQERISAGVEVIGDDDIARALLYACLNAPELVQRTYDQLLSSGSVLPSPVLRLRMLRSLLTVMHEWTQVALAEKMGASSMMFGGFSTCEAAVGISQGIRDKLNMIINRYVTDVKRLALPPSQVETVARGFRELEEMLLGRE